MSPARPATKRRRVVAHRERRTEVSGIAERKVTLTHLRSRRIRAKRDTRNCSNN